MKIPGLRESYLRSYIGQIEGIADATLAVAEDHRSTRDIAEDMAVIHTKALALVTLLRARLASLGGGPVRHSPERHIGFNEDRPDSLQDATGDVSSFFQDVDLGDVNDDGRAA